METYNKYEYTYDYPAWTWLHKCHYCRRRLSNWPLRNIVKGERWWWAGEPHIEIHYWCSEECAKNEQDEERGLLNANEGLNDRLDGERKEKQ